MDTASFFKIRKKMQSEAEKLNSTNYTEYNNIFLNREIKLENDVEVKVERIEFEDTFENYNNDYKSIILNEELIIKPEVVHVPREAPNKKNKKTTSKTVYNCHQCTETFCSNQARSKHYKTQHNSLTCKHCGKTFTKIANLNVHLNYVCPKDDQTKKNNREKKYGMYTHPFICDICKKSYTHRNTLITHLKIHNGKKVLYKCKFCVKSYTKKHNLKCHINSKHNNGHTYFCKTCNKGFGWRWALLCHEKTKHNIIRNKTKKNK